MKTCFRLVLALLMIAIGILHFLKPLVFASIVPDYLPFPVVLVYISGFFEVLGGAGLLFQYSRRYAAWGLIALYVAVFPANVHMAIHQVPINGVVYHAASWIRLPFQAVLIAWAWWFTHPDKSNTPIQ